VNYRLSAVARLLMRLLWQSTARGVGLRVLYLPLSAHVRHAQRRQLFNPVAGAVMPCSASRCGSITDHVTTRDVIPRRYHHDVIQ